MLVLFTDFGATDLYVGQVHATLHALAPRVRVVDALHDAPDRDVLASAHLLAALATRYPQHSTFLAVVDPGVGSVRDAVVVDADGRRFVGPDNGLFSVLLQRASRRRVRRIAWRPRRLSTSFHGRDLFAPVAARLAGGRLPRAALEAKPLLDVTLDAADLARVIYIDHYGNAMTGLRAGTLPAEARLRVARRSLHRAAVFASVPVGRAFWYENSLGLAEVAVNRGRAADVLGLSLGDPVHVLPRRGHRPATQASTIAR